MTAQAQKPTMRDQCAAPAFASAAAVKLWLSERFAQETDPDVIVRIVTTTLGRFLQVSHVSYGEVEPDGDWIIIRADWTDGVDTMAGRHRLSQQSSTADAYRHGRTLVISTDESEPSAVDETGARSLVAVPLIHDGVLVALFKCEHCLPRTWSNAEVELIQQTGARMWSALEHARMVAELRASEEQFRQLAENVPGLCWLADGDGTPTWANAAFLDYFAADDITSVTTAMAVHPDDAQQAAAIWVDALDRGIPVDAVVRLRGRDGEYRPFLSRATPIRDAAGAVTRWTAVMVDLTEQRQRDEHKQFFDVLADTIRDEPDAGRILAAVGDMLKAYLGVSRVMYSEVDPADPMTFVVHREAADASLTGATGRYRFDERFASLRARLAAGATIAWSSLDGDDAPPAPIHDFLRKLKTVAAINVPLTKDGRLVALLSVHSPEPRRWTAAERALLEDVAERIWSTVSRARAEAELKERERSQAFLVGWTDRLRGEHDPATLLDTSLELLGRHLGADRAVYSEIKIDDGNYTIISEWSDGVAPVRGLTYPASNLSDVVRNAYLAGETVASDDLLRDERYSAIAREKFGEAAVAARIGVPLTRDRRVQAILAVDTKVPRRWTGQEVRLVEEVAQRVWTLLQQARAETALKQREREQALLLAWSDRVRGEARADAIIAATLATIGGHLDASRVSYMEAAADDPHLFTVLDSWCNGGQSVRGHSFSLDWIGEAVSRRFLAGESVQSSDVTVDANVSQRARDLYAATDIVAVLSVPLVREGVVRAVLSASLDRPRQWTWEERQILRELADRMWSMLERARAEAALRRREADQAFLLAWSDRLRQLAAPGRILHETLERLVKHLGVDRASYAESDATGDLFTIIGSYGDDAGMIGETYRLSDASAEIGRIWRAGGAIHYDDVLGHPWVTAERAAFYARMNTRSFLSVPLFVDGVTGGTLSVQSATPHQWQASEERLVREVAERLWTTLQRARATATLADRERDQTFLLAWSDRLRQLIQPQDILSETLTLLNDHLGASRSVWAESDWVGDEMIVLAASDGQVNDERYRLADVPPSVREHWLIGGAIRYDDLVNDPRMPAERVNYYAAFGIRSFLSVPLAIDGVVRATLSVRCNEPRAWRDDEEQLIRDVAERLWIALERARTTAKLGERERDQAFLLAWGDRLRTAYQSHEILGETLAAIGAYLGATRATFSQARADGRTFDVLDDWCCNSFSIAGTSFSLDDVGAAVERDWVAGDVVRYDDVSRDPRMEPAYVPGYLDAEIAAFVSVPLMEGGRVRCALSVQSKTPRQWQDHEIALLHAVAERTWIILERARVQDELSAQQRVQTFLIGWSDRVRNEVHPRSILALTLETLGRQLGATRANYAECDAAVTQMTVVDVWGAETAERGTVFPFAVLGETVVAESVAGQTLIVDDVATDPRFADVLTTYRAVEVAAVVTVPLVRAGRLIAVLSVQQDSPRHWTSHEVRLIEEVADRTWSVLERARSEARLSESEAQLSAFMDNAPIAMYLKDRAGRYVRLNRQMGLVLGVDADKALGGTTHDFMPHGVARDVTRLDALALEGGIHSGEIHIDGRDAYLDALSVRFPIPGRDGAVERLGGFVLDMTERKRAEAALERSREALFQTEKLSALGSLLAGVSHELNNPLSIVVAQAVMMERQASGTDLAQRAFKIRKAADRCARIVQTFLAMARQKRPERAPVDLNDIVRAAVELTEYGLRSEHIEIALDLDPALPRIAADADQLHQIIVNLIVNAQQALAEYAGKRTVTVTTATGPEPQTVVLDVADTGPGIPAEVARRIFEPFFTTKPQGEGTGVGLSFSQGLAEAHGGRLSLLPGNVGACFRLTLPLDADGVLAAAAPETIAALAPRRRRALVIDDEGEIAEALADFLSFEGYHCDIAVGGIAGKERLATNDYDLVVSDLRMPELDGPALYRWLCEARPRLAERIAFTTGDTLGSTVARFLADTKRPVLEKPFVPEAVRRFLDQVEQP